MRIQGRDGETDSHGCMTEIRSFAVHGHVAEIGRLISAVTWPSFSCFVWTALSNAGVFKRVVLDVRRGVRSVCLNKACRGRVTEVLPRFQIHDCWVSPSQMRVEVLMTCAHRRCAERSGWKVSKDAQGLETTCTFLFPTDLAETTTSLFVVLPFACVSSACGCSVTVCLSLVLDAFWGHKHR